MDFELIQSASLVAARAAAARLRAAGFQAYFAGGAVRDLLLGHAAKDFDVATSARPEEAIALFAAAGMRTLEVGAHFGVVLLVTEDGGERVETEIATFRHDGVYLDGRRPEAVRFSCDSREDVVRRDFTINGMLLDPALMEDVGGDRVRVPEAAILDFVGGRDDLAAKLVRTIGDANQRFEEDKLRMLRGVRFAARLGFRLEAATLAAMRRHAAEIGQVSQERVRDELTRMLTERHARAAFEMLDATGLLQQVLPEVAKMKGVEQPPAFHPEGDVWVHTLLLLENLPPKPTCELAWGFLLHDVGKPATFQPPDPRKPGDRIRFNGHVEAGMRVAEVLLNRLRFSNEAKAQILALIRHHMQFGDVKAMKQSTLKRFIRLPKFAEHLALHRADCLSAHGDLRLWEFAKDAYEHDEPEAARPKWLVTGRELIAAGYKPGVAFKKMLEAVEDAQLEGRISTVKDGLELVLMQFGPPTGAEAKTTAP
jgi:poly(A) polymerase